MSEVNWTEREGERGARETQRERERTEACYTLTRQRLQVCAVREQARQRKEEERTDLGSLLSILADPWSGCMLKNYSLPKVRHVCVWAVCVCVCLSLSITMAALSASWLTPGRAACSETTSITRCPKNGIMATPITKMMKHFQTK